jgi:APA family basic amino acid/polyamine antiporter
VRPGGSGRLIADEAREMRAHALVMPLPPRTGTTLFGKTVETVLADRPCRVIIESEPTNV